MSRECLLLFGLLDVSRWAGGDVDEGVGLHWDGSGSEGCEAKNECCDDSDWVHTFNVPQKGRWDAKQGNWAWRHFDWFLSSRLQSQIGDCIVTYVSREGLVGFGGTMPQGNDQIDQMDRVFKALADPTRRALMDLLKDGPRTTTQLVESFPSMTRFGVMKHLGVLDDAGLVLSRKDGRTRWYHLNAVPLRMVYERWVSTYEDQWSGSLVRLQESVERKQKEGKQS